MTLRDRLPAAGGPLAIATAVLLTLLLAGPATASARKRDRGCYPAHTKTLAASSRIRVFESRKVIPETRTHVTYGCLLSGRKPFQFHRPDFPTGFEPIALAGRFVAYGAYSDCAASFCDPNSVVLQDLRNGRVTFADGPLRVANVSALVLRTNGSLAWIQTSFDVMGILQTGFQVVKAERGRAPVVLASGPDIAGDSLALAGATIYWTKGASPVSALLG